MEIFLWDFCNIIQFPLIFKPKLNTLSESWELITKVICAQLDVGLVLIEAFDMT
jgi:hypothetical protein